MAQAQRSASTSVIVDAIRASGTVSRVGLTVTTGLTGATVSTVVRRLIDDGLVVETGRAESTGGKPRVLLELDPTARYAVGVHLDHASITCTVTDLAGTSVALSTHPGPGTRSPAEVLVETAAEVDRLVDEAGVDRSRVLGIGFVAPGPLTSDGGMHRTPPEMRAWTDYPITSELGRLTGLPVVLENDATASAIGEHWAGGTGTENSFAVLYMGTGLGAGLVLDGVAYRGSSGNAGEIGHTTLDLDGPVCWCGTRGCVEVLAGPAAVVAEARRSPDLAAAAGLSTGTSGSEPQPSVVSDLAAVARAAAAGHPGARDVLERSARYVAAAALTAVNLLDVRMLVLTGASLAAAGDIYLPAVRGVLASSLFARGAHPVDVRLSRTAATAPALGGAALVLQTHLVPAPGPLTSPGPLAPPRHGTPPGEPTPLST
ncbi:transcriptional regulator/sugar kinase [Sanguibacter keddieii DSM 10542]|uniref:Transcriptional regulator/sugar kinase n=1 Tax=Sanguibacter keddieii (strain ATCC 51767 / DSM 10542 / NCFB 3025 / ST-74) TaxID=446469 RepID=D1BCW6_SANKS|nr:ROK family protein [Sanguibacter keddieii]ACZ20964.1 transcriptional regulator/sugar kinase [Sanguibacter keddieii DSM 10542]